MGNHTAGAAIQTVYLFLPLTPLNLNVRRCFNQACLNRTVWYKMRFNVMDIERCNMCAFAFVESMSSFSQNNN